MSFRARRFLVIILSLSALLPAQGFGLPLEPSNEKFCRSRLLPLGWVSRRVVEEFEKLDSLPAEIFHGKREASPEELQTLNGAILSYFSDHRELKQNVTDTIHDYLLVRLGSKTVPSEINGNSSRFLKTVTFFIGRLDGGKSIPHLTHGPTEKVFAQVRSLMERLRNRYFRNVDQKLLGTLPDLKVLSHDGRLNTDRKLVGLLDSGQTQITMRRKSRSRDLIAFSGFETQRIGGKSGGHFEPDFRDRAEAKFADLATEDYSKLEDRVFPKYAYLRLKNPGKPTNFQMDLGTDRYGDDLYIFKAQNVQERSTFTVGDSLAKYNPNLSPAPYSEINKIAYCTTLDKNGIFQVATREGHETNRFGEASLHPGLNPNLKSTSTELLPFQASTDYIEVQIYGPLALDDVEEFIFTDYPPTGAFLEELNRRNITIRDGRKIYVGYNSEYRDYNFAPKWNP